MLMDLSPHIKDLITAYESMPPNMRRSYVIAKLQEAYLLATSDGLESLLSKNSTHVTSGKKTSSTAALRTSK